ncbi:MULTISPECIES: hypothetical protein [Methylobacterium]|uniref:hypothetical protein n=1 Tax=Methylobacterium TaxID=407 RepID=UPI0013EA11BD|nr:hypothetical protein [Methylobacterium sp. DB0501]NGM36164.1 hypothetical protein [Methylobacterium sp. DB0501]
MNTGNRGGSDVTIFRVGGDGNLERTESRSVGRPAEWNATGDIKVYLIVSRFESDHALTYLFCHGPRSVAHVQEFVDRHPDRFRGSNAVVELAENYFNLSQAKHRAVALRTWLGNVNVIFPPVKL